MFILYLIRESVDSLCRDGADTPIVRVHIKYIKHFQKMYRDVGMAMPKTTETRCRDGSVQGRHVIQRLHN